MIEASVVPMTGGPQYLATIALLGEYWSHQAVDSLEWLLRAFGNVRVQPETPLNLHVCVACEERRANTRVINGKHICPACFAGAVKAWRDMQGGE